MSRDCVLAYRYLELSGNNHWQELWLLYQQVIAECMKARTALTSLGFQFLNLINCNSGPLILLALTSWKFLSKCFWSFCNSESIEYLIVSRLPQCFYKFLISIKCHFFIFRAERRFRKRAFALIDNNNTPYVYVMAINRWLGIRLVSQLIRYEHHCKQPNFF